MFWIIQESAIEGHHCCEVLQCAETEETAKKLLIEEKEQHNGFPLYKEWKVEENTDVAFSVGSQTDYANNHVSLFLLNGHKSMATTGRHDTEIGCYWVMVEYRLQYDGVDAYNNIVMVGTTNLEQAKAVLTRYTQDERTLAKEKGMTIVQDSDVFFHACDMREKPSHTCVYILQGTSVL